MKTTRRSSLGVLAALCGLRPTKRTLAWGDSDSAGYASYGGYPIPDHMADALIDGPAEMTGELVFDEAALSLPLLHTDMARVSQLQHMIDHAVAQHNALLEKWKSRKGPA
jgi:hypothetical protein